MRSSKNENLCSNRCGWSDGHRNKHRIACTEANRRPERREKSRELMRKMPKRKKGEFHHTEESKLLIGKIGKGRKAWNEGLTKEDPRVAKYAAKQLGKKKSSGPKLKESWKVPEVREARLAGASKSWFKKGEHPHNYGISPSEVTIEKYRQGAYRRILRNSQRKGFFETAPERKMRSILDALGIIYKHPYPINNILHRYPADFYIPGSKLVIEVDGKFWHYYPNGTAIDKIRTKELQGAGYKVLRFWEGEFDLEIVQQALRNFLQEV
jgi:very-short-patch-repair endonuclease